MATKYVRIISYLWLAFALLHLCLLVHTHPLLVHSPWLDVAQPAAVLPPSLPPAFRWILVIQQLDLLDEHTQKKKKK